MDKDILMIEAIRKIVRILNQFSAGAAINPGIKEKLDPKRRDLAGWFIKFTGLLLEETDLITDPELEFAGKIKDVILYGIDREQPLVLAATDQLNTYIKEKIALVRLKLAEKGVHPLDPGFA
ncbi:MAG: hypothetical protein IPN74_08890 [Haliscomenobacter sp.]|nr:hypothetical protein [Haliscomenobacter sp.]